MKIKTYIIENKFKDYKFSEGEDMNEMDLEAVASRSRTSYIEYTPYIMERDEDNEFDDSLEYIPEMNDVFSSHISQATLVPEELQYDSGDSFTIGNNIKGGI